jgi:hypothetical protein
MGALADRVSRFPIDPKCIRKLSFDLKLTGPVIAKHIFAYCDTTMNCAVRDQPFWQDFILDAYLAAS